MNTLDHGIQVSINQTQLLDKQGKLKQVALDSAYYTQTTCFMAVKSTTGSPPQPQQAYTTDNYDVILQSMVRIM